MTLQGHAVKNSQPGGDEWRFKVIRLKKTQYFLQLPDGDLSSVT